jgi:hypothetical protein
VGVSLSPPPPDSAPHPSAIDAGPPPLPPPVAPGVRDSPWGTAAPASSPSHRGWAPALAIGIVFALVVVTATGALLIARAVGSGFPDHAPLSIPSIVPVESPAARPVPPSGSSLTALHTLLSATPTTPGATIDPQLAARIVDTLWPIREQALDTNDVGTLAGFETGSALQGDTADQVTITCGCSGPLPRPVATQYLFVPKQSAYPSWFISELTTSPVEGSSPDVSLMVFTRASPATQWMVSLETGYSFASGAAWVYATPEAMAGGFDLPTPTRNELPGDLAAYYQYWANAGSAPTSPFAPGVFTSAIGQTQAKLDTTLAGEGQVHRVVYSIDLAHDGVWSVAANNVAEQPVYGWGLTCGTVRYEAVTTLASGAAPMVQPVDRSTWGSTLTPGRYTEITQWGLHESCFLDDTAGVPFIVLGHNGGVIRSVGVSAG